MKSAVLTTVSWEYLPAVGVILFLAVFIGVVWIVTRPERKESFDEASRMPLNDGFKKGSEI